MENLNNHVSVDQQPIKGLKRFRYPPYHPKTIPWLDVRVFYVRVSNLVIDDSTPEHLTLNHIPLGPETILEVNGGRSSAYSDYVSVQLRRDRIDKNSEEATFVCTDSIRMSGSVRYEVYDGNDILLSGVLKLSNGNDSIGEVQTHNKKWNIKCQSHVAAARYFLKGEQFISPEILVPTVEVYVAGCFSGTPIILTKTLQIGSPNKHDKKSRLPESKSTELEKDALKNAAQISEYRDYRSDHDLDDEYNSLYPTRSYMEGDDGELSWFNAGVRVGVGIGLGICVGVGLGVGLLVRSYQATSRNFKRRLL